jgi:hypothetical protein
MDIDSNSLQNTAADLQELAVHYWTIHPSKLPIESWSILWMLWENWQPGLGLPQMNKETSTKILPDLQLLNSLMILTKSDMDEGTLIM